MMDAFQAILFASLLVGSALQAQNEGIWTNVELFLGEPTKGIQFLLTWSCNIPNEEGVIHRLLIPRAAFRRAIDQKTERFHHVYGLAVFSFNRCRPMAPVFSLRFVGIDADDEQHHTLNCKVALWTDSPALSFQMPGVTIWECRDLDSRISFEEPLQFRYDQLEATLTSELPEATAGDF